MNQETRVKICGLRETEHMIAAAEAGADFVGMIFAESKRKVTTEKAIEMVRALHKLEHPPVVVGVFVNAPAEKVNRIAGECDLDLVQLSGNEDSAYCLEIEKPVIQVLHISREQTAADVISEIEQGFKDLQDKDVIYLLDTAVKGAYGGTGQSFNRQIAIEVAKNMPVLVAGGLTPDNVADMVREVRPWGVDVSSGVETDGAKDIEKIKAFIAGVKAVTGDEK